MLKILKRSFSQQSSQHNLRVLVTGGSNGIGKGIVSKYASTGANVVSVDIDELSNKKLELQYSNVKCFNLDICDTPNTPKKVIQYMIDKYNGIDILINNVGVLLSHTIPLHEFPNNDWEKTLSINLSSVFYFSKYSIQQMLKQKNINNNSFNIINIASVAGIQAEKGLLAYCATKGGVISLTQQMALEYAPKIRVNSISPGGTHTELVEKAFEKAGITMESVAAHYPMQRLGKVEEIAELIYFLTSDKAGFITGSNFVVDGGCTKKGGWTVKTGNEKIYKVD